MNADGHIGHNPSQISISPDPGGKCRFSSTNISITCLCHGTTHPNAQLVNDLNVVELLTIECGSGAIIYQDHKLNSWYQILRKLPSVSKYTIYNGMCGNNEASGTPHAHEPLPSSVWRSCDGIQGTPYHQTTGKTRKA